MLASIQDKSSIPSVGTMPAPAKSARQRFREETSGPDENICLARAALLIASEEYPQLPIDRYIGRLDLLALEVRDRLNGETAPLIVLQELTETLFRRRNFRSNREAYYDPRNSLLSDVLDRGLGIPLTLGIVMLEVGWRLDLPLTGVNFPGHFLVRFEGDSLKLLIDPFDSGKPYFEDEAQILLDKVYGGMVMVRKRFLREASRRDMLVRMLTNLKGIYRKVNDLPRTLASIERILVLRPTARTEVRDRGVVLAKLGRFDEAVEYLQAYLAVDPEAGDADHIAELVVQLRRRAAE
jgi:regulator of sirC expression with transglutaminase-like and TPR domain